MQGAICKLLLPPLVCSWESAISIPNWPFSPKSHIFHMFIFQTRRSPHQLSPLTPALSQHRLAVLIYPTNPVANLSWYLLFGYRKHPGPGPPSSEPRRWLGRGTGASGMNCNDQNSSLAALHYLNCQETSFAPHVCTHISLCIFQSHLSPGICSKAGFLRPLRTMQLHSP